MPIAGGSRAKQSESDLFHFCSNEIRLGTLEASPSLGIVVAQLKNCVEYYNREKHAYDGLKRQRDALISSLHINQKGKPKHERNTALEHHFNSLRFQINTNSTF